MKEIKAIIRPFKLLEVIEALQNIENLPGVTISEIRGFGKSHAKNAKDKVVYEMVDVIPRIKLELVVADEMVTEVVNTIQQTAHTGNTGDGKIFIIDVVAVVKIRTNQHGEDAI
ncbi:MAG: P-II family nitrogen regulator [Ignavibacteriales bacterium]|nr:P-II family nitrogen regulator [Ignavibacteriales bacterium]